MAEFSIYPEQLRLQAARLDDISAQITAVQMKVAAAAAGLGPIGLAEVGPAISAIEVRLAKHKLKVQSLSNALNRIIQKFLLTEATIQGEVLQFMIEQIMQGAAEGISQFLDGVSDWAQAFGDFVTSIPTFTSINFEGLGGAIGLGLTAELFNFNNNSDAYAHLFDENGNFSPEALAFFSGEGSIFSLDESFHLGDFLDGTNVLTLGEYNLDTLVQAGLYDEFGNINPQLAAYLDGEFIGVHDIATVNFGDFNQRQYDLKIGDLIVHGGIGNTLSEMGAGGYASATALDLTQTDRFGFTFLNVFNQGKITIGSAEAGIGADFGLLDQDGHFNPHFFVGEVADAAAFTVADSVGVSVGGIDFAAGGSLSVGDVGEGIFAYMHDGQIAVNTGIGIGEGGASLVLSMDMSNSPIYQYGQAGVDYFLSGQAETDISNAYNYVASGEAWSDVQDFAYDTYDYVTSGEAWSDFQSTASDTYDYVTSGEAWDDFSAGAKDAADYVFDGGLWSDITSFGVGH